MKSTHVAFWFGMGVMAASLAFAAPQKAAEITVSGYTGASTLENFPVLVRISEAGISGFSYADCASEGADISFKDASGTTLDFDIDTWDTSGTSLVWVKVPALSGDATKIIFRWKDANPAAHTPSDTWSDYTGVWHLNETTDGITTISDSTANDLSGTSVTSSKKVDVGKVGRARLITTYTTNTAGQPYDSGITIPLDNAAKLSALDSLVPAFTASMWIRPQNPSGKSQYNYLISQKQADKDPGWGAQFHQDDIQFSPIRIYAAYETDNGKISVKSLNDKDTPNGAVVKGDSTGITSKKWAKLDISWTSDAKYIIYVNGAEVSRGALAKSIPAINNGLAKFSVGGALAATNNLDKAGRGFYGDMDEVRLHANVLSADWVEADYKQVYYASFLTYGAAYSPDGALKVSGTPAEIGSPTPAYGRVENLSVNDTVALSMPAAVVPGEGTVTNYLTGWQLESVNAETGARALLRTSSDEGESIDQYDYTHASFAEFTWLWDVRDRLGVGTPTVVSKGLNTLVLSSDVTGIGYTAPSATLKFVYGPSPDALLYTNVVSASVTKIGDVPGTLSRLLPGGVYYVKAVIETNDEAHDVAVSEAVCIQTDTLVEDGEPGLWQTFFTGAKNDWTRNVWSLPVGTDWLNYTDANRIRRRELTPIGAYTGGNPLANCSSYVSEVWGDLVTWPANGGQWAYVGHIYLDASKSYKFRTNMDDFAYIAITDAATGTKTVLINRDSNGSATSSTYSPSVTGWNLIEMRFADNSGGVGGSSTSATHYNTTSLGISYDDGTTWNLLQDPGDGSLLRASPTIQGRSTITATEVIANGTLSSIALSFPAAESARALRAAWGPVHGGNDPADWYATTAVSTVAAEATSASWSVPADWGSDSNLVVRFYFDGTQIEWSNSIFWRDYTTPAITDMAVNGSGGDTLVVSGNLAFFPGADCTLSVYTGDSPTTLTNAWTGLAGSVRDATGDFSLSLFEPDTSAVCYLAPGSTHYVSVEAVSGGKVSRTAVAQVKMVSSPATFATKPTASVVRRTATFAGRLESLGMGNAANVSVWYGTENNAESFIPLGAATNVTDTSAFSIVADFPAVNVTYYWLLRAVSTASGGTAAATNVSAIVTTTTQDNSIYTWKAKDGDWNGDWNDPGHWEASPAADAFGYPDSAAATAIFPLGQSITVTISANATVGTLDLSAYDITGATALDVTFKGAAGEDGGTNRVLTVSTLFNVKSPLGTVTLDNAAIKVTGGHVEPLTGKTLRLVNGADLYVNNTCNVYSGSILDLAGQSSANINYFNIGGNGSTLALDDSRLTIRANSVFENRGSGSKIIFKGASPLIYISKNSDTLYWQGNLLHDMVFHIPAGGYSAPVIQCTSSMAINNLFRQNGKTSAALTLSVADDSPFYSTIGTLDQPLIAWSGTKAIDTSTLRYAEVADGGYFMLGTSATADYGFVNVASFSGTAKSLGVHLVSVVHDGRLTVASDASQPLDGYSPALGDSDGYAADDTVTLVAPTGVTSNGVHYTCTGYTLVEYAAGDAKTIVSTTTVTDGTSSFTYTFPAGRAEITWHYAEGYPVTATAVNDAGGSIALSSPCVSATTPVTLTASTVTDGKEFQYWYGDVPYESRYDNPIVISGDKAKGVFAFFGATAANGGERVATWYTPGGGTYRNWFDAGTWTGGVIPGTNDTAVLVSTRGDTQQGQYKSKFFVPSFFAVRNLVVSNACVYVAANRTDFGLPELRNDQNGYRYYNVGKSYDAYREEPVGFDVSGDVFLRPYNSSLVNQNGTVVVGGSQQRCFSKVNIGGDLVLENGALQVNAGHPFDFVLDPAKAIDGPRGFIEFPYTNELWRGNNFIKVGGDVTLAASSGTAMNFIQVANDFRTGAAVWLDFGDVTIGERACITAFNGGYGKFNASGVADGSNYSMCPGGHGTSDNPSGGSHGGFGGSETENPGYQKPTTHIGTYDFEFAPLYPGSGNSGNGGIDSRGGGSIRLDCDTLTLDGGLVANGHNAGGNKGGGAGGSIWVVCDTLNAGANCLFSAEGGSSTGDNSGAGGGRILVCEGMTSEQVDALYETHALPEGVTPTAMTDKFGQRASAKARISATTRSNGFDGTGWYLVNTAGKKTLTIAATPENLGFPTPGYGVQPYDEGDEVEIAAPDAVYITADNRTKRVCVGYTLVDDVTGETIADTSATSGKITVDANYTLTWKLTSVSHVVAIDATAGGTVATNAIGASGETWQGDGSTVSVTAVPDSGWRFAGWMGEVAESAQHDATISQTLSGGWRVRAVFVSDDAGTATWTGEGDGASFLDAANWSSGKTPGPQNDVFIGSGATVSVAAGLVFNVKSLSVASGASFSVLPEGTYWTYAATHDPHKTQEDIAPYDLHDCGLVASGSIAVSGTLVAGNRSCAADAKVVAGGDITIAEGASVTVHGGFNDALIRSTVPSVWRNYGAIVSAGGALTVDGILELRGDAVSGSPLKVSAATLTVGANGNLNANSGGFGWRTFVGLDATYGPGSVAGNNYNGGAYGGYGGGYNTPGYYANKKTYGDPLRPFIAGSNGGHGSGYLENGQSNGRRGGGALRIEVAGRIVNLGNISANGSSHGSGSGAGGSLWISCSRYRTGAGSVTTVNGGTCGANNGGCGGGGRLLVCERLTSAQLEELYATGVAPKRVVATEITDANAAAFANGTISAKGGLSTFSQTNPYFSGTDGSVWWLRAPAEGTKIILQ